MHKKVMPRYATCDIPGQKEIPLTVVVDEEAPTRPRSLRSQGSTGVVLGTSSGPKNPSEPVDAAVDKVDRAPPSLEEIPGFSKPRDFLLPVWSLTPATYAHPCSTGSE